MGWSLGTQDKLMRRALMWFNPYGRQAVQRKLKKGVKKTKIAFFSFIPIQISNNICDFKDDYPDFQQKAQK